MARLREWPARRIPVGGGVVSRGDQTRQSSSPLFGLPVARSLLPALLACVAVLFSLALWVGTVLGLAGAGLE